MIKTELPDLLFDEKAFENIKKQMNKEVNLQGNIETIRRNRELDEKM